MELTIEQALQQGIAAHKEGRLPEAERFYRAILQSQPAHPDANHNLGLIAAVSVNKSEEALPLFKAALDANPKVEQFWLSYADALIKGEKFKNAKQVIQQAKKQGVDGEKLRILESQLPPLIEPENLASPSPPQQQLNSLLGYYQNGQIDEAEKLATSTTKKYPEHQLAWKVLGGILWQSGRGSEAIEANQRALQLVPQDAEAHNNLSVMLKQLGRLVEAEASSRQAILLKPDFPEAHINLGIALQALGRLEEAEESHRQAIILKPDLVEAHSNLGSTLSALGRLVDAEASYRQVIALKPEYPKAHNLLGITLKKIGRLEEAEASYRQAITLKPNYPEAYNNLSEALQEQTRLEEAEASLRQAIDLKADFAVAFWNLGGIEKTIKGAEHWIDECLIAEPDHQQARLMKAALRFYQGDRAHYDNLMKSESKQHPYMRSFTWAFGLLNLPELHFNKWYFFDAIIKKSVVSKPFYEFGVWRASSFKYLIKVFKKGYGFDTFSGLPEDWDVQSHVEKAGHYSNDGNVPNINGGEFIVGEFEDTLPAFFSETRPMASVINFDADLYSSTICALNFSKSVIDKDTILIFDEFIMNDSWEQDEFKALNEFCSNNHCSYEVIAISFFTKQVAVKLTGI